ncbi:hypothetical protein WK55_09345 [Burkholderia ubonensis]|nr:hypothetical protein WK55_09345 [Burkholderia ubonensis]
MQAVDLPIAVDHEHKLGAMAGAVRHEIAGARRPQPDMQPIVECKGRIGGKRGDRRAHEQLFIEHDAACRVVDIEENEVRRSHKGSS